MRAIFAAGGCTANYPRVGVCWSSETGWVIYGGTVGLVIAAVLAIATIWLLTLRLKGSRRRDDAPTAWRRPSRDDKPS